MEEVAAGDSKPVLVRLKRKLYQDPVDFFWLEVNERPLKRALQSFDNLSISNPTGRDEETSRRFLMQHVDTIESVETTEDALVSFLIGDGATDERLKKMDERRNMCKQLKLKRDQICSPAVQRHEDMARNARFEQIWKSRNRKQDNGDSLCERYRLFDIVRVDDSDEMLDEAQESKNVPIDDADVAILGNYLPLVKEFLPLDVANEIEREVLSNTGGYVFDIYTMDDAVDEKNADDDLTDHLLVKVDDFDYYDDVGPSGSEYDSEDSNAENGDKRDYPEEPSSGSEEEREESEESFGEGDGFEGSYSEYDMEELEMEMHELKWRYL